MYSTYFSLLTYICFYLTMPFSDKANSTVSTTTPTTARSKLLFTVQVSTIIFVIICALINLSISHYTQHIDQKDDKLWIVLLSSSLGYLLPNPKLKSELKVPI